MAPEISPAARDFVTSVGQLPTLPENIQEIIHAVGGDGDFAAMARKIEKDPALAARIIKAANSIFYGGVVRSSTVALALGRLGTSEARGLILSAAVVGAFQGLQDRLDLKLFWRHSFATGLASGIAARLKGRAGTAEGLSDNPFYTAGLVHHLGILVEALEAPEKFVNARLLAREKGWSLAQAEQQLMGFDHCHVGAALLEAWRFPEETVDAALYHLSPDDCPRHRQCVQAVHLGSLLAHELGEDGGFEGVAPWLSENAFYELGWQREELPQLSEHLRAALERAAALGDSLLN
jgi:HD-like signal output (HDOD) protein